MPWQVLIILSVILYSISSVVQKVLLKDDKNDPIAFSLLFQFSVGIIVGLFSFSIGRLQIPNLQPHLFNLFIMVILYGFGNILLFKSLQKIDASKFAILFSGRALFTILASSVLILEGLSLKQYFGVFLILAGIILVNLQSKKLEFGKYDLLAILAAATYGLANTNDRILLKSIDLYSFVTLGFLLPPIMTQILYFKKLPIMVKMLNRKFAWKLLVLCILYATSALLFFAALQNSNNSSQVVSINLSSVIFTVLLATIFLKENKNILKKIIASVICFAGLIILS